MPLSEQGEGHEVVEHSHGFSLSLVFDSALCISKCSLLAEEVQLSDGLQSTRPGLVFVSEGRKAKFPICVFNSDYLWCFEEILKILFKNVFSLV